MKLTTKKIAIIITAVISAGILIWLVMKPEKKTVKVKDEDMSIIQSLSDESWDTPRPPVSEENIYEIEKKKFIRDIVIEKDPICAGEDFQVEILAENPDGPESELTYRIGGKFGNPVILRFRKPGEKAVHVFVRDSRENVDHKRYTVNVVNCPGKPSIYLKAQYSSTRAEEADFEVSEKKGLEGKCTYEWDFGDGMKMTTDRGFATHNYGKREQTQFTSTFTVSVTVTDEKGAAAVGRTSLSFPNIHWISSKMGRHIIPIIYNRFPEKHGGSYEIGIKVKNIYESKISFTTADVTFRSCIPDSKATSTSVGASSYMSLTEIKGGEIVDDVIVFPRVGLPKSTCGMIITLNGEFPDGKPVTGRINLTIPMTKEEALKTKHAREVTDEELIEKIKMARKILGRQIVTPADIRKLEKEGKL